MSQQPSVYPQQPPMSNAPRSPLSAPSKKRRRGRLVLLIIVAVIALGIIGALINHPSASSPTLQATATSDTSSASTSAPASTPNYPPQTVDDLHGLAAQGDASAIHEFDSESVGLTGACPQPKREVTVDPSLTGQSLAEDLLAYFYGQPLDSPCGSIVFAFHSQAEVNAGNGYTAGRILLQVDDSSGQSNVDPNATNLTYTLTLDTGDALSGQEYVVTYTS